MLKIISGAPLLFGLLTLFAFTGCDVATSDDDDVLTITPAPVFITFPRLAPIAPPAPLPETAEIAIEPTKEIWRPGYWDYDGATYHWISGHLMPRPAPTAVWAPDTWVQHRYGWGFHPGYWQ